jgi:hypothetical protein
LQVTISTQQIQTVLRTYNKQLKIAGLNKSKRAEVPQSRKDEVKISIEGKRQQIYQQAANHVVEKITKNDTAVPAKVEREQEG